MPNSNFNFNFNSNSVHLISSHLIPSLSPISLEIQGKRSGNQANYLPEHRLKSDLRTLVTWRFSDLGILGLGTCAESEPGNERMFSIQSSAKSASLKGSCILSSQRNSPTPTIPSPAHPHLPYPTLTLHYTPPFLGFCPESWPNLSHTIHTSSTHTFSRRSSQFQNVSNDDNDNDNDNDQNNDKDDDSDIDDYIDSDIDDHDDNNNNEVNNRHFEIIVYPPHQPSNCHTSPHLPHLPHLIHFVSTPKVLCQIMLNQWNEMKISMLRIWMR
jgi:hypothetical protein